MDDEPKVQQLENRIDSLESTIEKMMPSRRDALKMGGAALVGGAAMSGTASAGTNQVGTIGSQASPVDLESEDINNADTVTTDTLDSTTVNNSGTVTTDTLDSTTVDNSGTVTTQDIVVNGTATGPFGGGGIVLEAGDSITVETIFSQDTDETLMVLYDGGAKDVLGGTMHAPVNLDFRYVFSDNTSLKKNGTGTTYQFGNASGGKDGNDDQFETDFLPPAKQVKKIEIGGNFFGSGSVGAEVILKD
jgi:hypothetical protein